MNHIFIKRDKARFMATHLVSNYFKLEQDSIGSMSVVYCDSLEDVFTSIDRMAEIDYSDYIEIIGLVPTAADLSNLRALANGAMISLILSKNQITPEISGGDEITHTADDGILTNVWKFYNSHFTPNFIEKLDMALSTERKPDDGLTEMHDLLDRLDVLSQAEAMELIEKVLEETTEEGQDG